MVLNMPTQTLVLLIVALLLLAIGLAAIASASGMTIPLFDQIGNLIKGLAVTS
jgi:hypothetical protein